MDNIYLHAIYAFYKRYRHEDTIKKLKYILESDAILSRRLQMNNDPYGFNGIDYISLCDYEKRNLHHKGMPDYTAYYSYIRESLSLMFPKDKIEVIKPKMVDFIGLSKSGLDRMLELGLSKEQRYSDLYDEVQVKDIVPLTSLNGVTMPLDKMVKGFIPENIATSMVQRELEQIKELLIKYNHEVPMYDIDSFISLDDDQNVKTLVKEYYNKI